MEVVWQLIIGYNATVLREWSRSCSLAARHTDSALIIKGAESTNSSKNMVNLSDKERKFLEVANDPELRTLLLERLEKLGLRSAFLRAESETIPKAACLYQK